MFASLVIPMVLASIVVALGILALADELARDARKPLLAFTFWFVGLTTVVISPIVSFIVLSKAGLM